MKRPPAFHAKVNPTLPARLLQPFGLAYDLGARTRIALTRPQHAACPVICIGNLTLGGAGKTPTALYAARRLKLLGLSPTFLTRGYGGTVRAPSRVPDTGATADQFGDEALLLARVAPTIVSANRPKGAALATRHETDAIVMDDGFQNPTLHKDVSILVVDAGAGIGNGLVFPAGPLRMTLSAQAKRAQALIVIGDGSRADPVIERAQDMTVLRGSLAPDPDIARRLEAARVIGFAGIGRPDKLFTTLREIGADVVETRSFPDHHVYTRDDARQLLAAADRTGALLVTTEKDAVRLAGTKDADLAELRQRLTVLPVHLRFLTEDAQRFDDLLRRAATC
ncbi:MAG: tetraacyldisaccharide 4'-kinase [Pseudomonadota bacterium]